MSDPKVIRFDRHAGQALPPWPDIPVAQLESGTPRQSGVTYFERPEIGLSAGIWECTAFTGRMEPYPVDEFMLILEGEVTIAEPDGRQTTIRAGESFILPRGLRCQWRQSGKMRKFFVIYEAPAGAATAPAAALQVIKPDHRLVPQEISPSPAAETLIGPVPSQRSHSYYTDPSGQFTVGIWDTSYYHRKVVPFPRYELMCFLDGAVSMTDAAGSGEKFAAGESVFVPMGAMADFKVAGEYLRKIYVIFMPQGHVRS